MGCLSREYRIQINPNVSSVITPPRKIPHAIKPKLKEEIDRLLRLNIIEPVSTPTEWVNAMVIVEKPNGKVRLMPRSKTIESGSKKTVLSFTYGRRNFLKHERCDGIFKT